MKLVAIACCYGLFVYPTAGSIDGGIEYLP